jgi:hypothetical protein
VCVSGNERLNNFLHATGQSSKFHMTTAQVIAQVNAALASNNRSTMLALAAQLDADNNSGCPLN